MEFRTWYDNTMELVTLGSLLQIRNRTYGWRDGRDYILDAGDVVVLYDIRSEDVVPGVPTVKVVHGEHGCLTCIALDLKLVEHTH